jgi:hypothetical protein
MHCFEIQGLAMQYRRLSMALKFPGKHGGVVFVIA